MFLAVDAGGTSTRAVLIDTLGRAYGYGRAHARDQGVCAQELVRGDRAAAQIPARSQAVRGQGRGEQPENRRPG